jgi:predicted nucleotidyltransferase
MSEFKNFQIKGSDKQVKRYIQDLCKQIVRVADPQKIILFGSYAYGEPNEDSDVDLLVVKPFEGHPSRQAFQLRLQLDTPMALDLLVRTPEYIAERLEMGDYFMEDILEEGKVLYEKDNAGVGKKGGGRLVKRAA